MPAKSSRGGSGWAFVMISILRFVLCWELLGLCFSPHCEHHYVAGFQPQMSPLQTWELVDSRRSPVHALKAAPTDVQIYEEKIEIRGEEMWYQIVAPSVQKLLATAHEPLVPLVCLHGGPGVPSASLEPLGRFAEEYGRTVIFYDQLGCGNSGAPMDPAFYSPSLLHSDLLVLMAHLRDVHDLRACHLLGHSWGGCLACEAVLGVSHSSTGSPLIPGQDNGVFLLVPDVELLSVVLSGTPSSIPLVEEEVGRLVEALAASSASQQQGGADPEATKRRFLVEDSLFKAAHYCRLPETPACVARALAGAGPPGVFRGTAAIPGWDARPALAAGRWPAELPALVLNGEHDFVTAACVAPFAEHIPNCRAEALAGCSHLTYLEDEGVFLRAVQRFLEGAEGAAVRPRPAQRG